MSNKIKVRKIKNENWVAKTLVKKQLFLTFITSFVCLAIFSIYAGEFALKINDMYNEQLDIEDAIKAHKEKINELTQKIKQNKDKLNSEQNSGIDEEELTLIVTKVCDMLKDKEAIGGYYILKEKNKTYKNVTDVEIQISFGDKNLLYTIMNMVMSEMYSIKKIEQTQLGVKFELYKK
jgi:cell division protein FtsL